MKIITPPPLSPGDTVCLVSTARKISREELQFSITLLKGWGLKPVFGKNLHKESNQFSGTDDERLSDIQNAINDTGIKAIFCAKGGYGTTRIVDRIDFTPLLRKPKWICGYSDVTAIHNHLHSNYNICSLHSAMPIGFHNNSPEALNSLRDALFGKFPEYTIPSHPFNRAGETEGVVVGGNLSMLYSLSGTNSDIDTKGKILFIEDLDEYLYHIDRMMQNFRKSGKLANLAGMIVGGMSDMNDNAVPYGKTAEEIIAEAIAPYGFPVCFNFPAGHIPDNRTIIISKKARLSVKNTVRLAFSP